MSTRPSLLRRIFRLTPAKTSLLITVAFLVLYIHSQRNQDFVAVAINLLESRAYDLRARWLTRSFAPPAADPIVIVAIDDKSLSYTGYPAPREQWTELTRRMKEWGANVLVYDLIFETPKDADPDFAAAIAEAGPEMKVVLAWSVLRDPALAASLKDHDFTGPIRSIESSRLPLSLYDQNLSTIWERSRHVRMAGLLAPVPPLAAATKYFGHTYYDPDHDGVFRWSPLLAVFLTPAAAPSEQEIVAYPSLDLATVMARLNAKSEVNSTAGGYEIRLGGTTIPTDSSGHVLINWRAPYRSFPCFSLHDVLAGFPDPPRFDPKIIFGGKIVLVGTAATGAMDYHATPLGTIAGVEIHAHIISNLLHNDPMIRSDWFRAVNLLILLALGILYSLIPRRVRPAVRASLALALLLVYLGFNHWFFIGPRRPLPLVLPLAEIIALHFAASSFKPQAPAPPPSPNPNP